MFRRELLAVSARVSRAMSEDPLENPDALGDSFLKARIAMPFTGRLRSLRNKSVVMISVAILRGLSRSSLMCLSPRLNLTLP